jgi:DNA-binding transcriptional LysR family regulator
MHARRYWPTLDRLQALRAVAQSGGFSTAANALGLTQPAVSNRIRHLEQELGVSLLERLGKTARPTPAGAQLIAAAARALIELDAALDAIALRRGEVAGPLSLATGATATKHLLPPVAADLRARHPGIDLRIITGNTVDLLPGIIDGDIDLGLLTGPIRDRRLATRAFFRDRLVCITPPGEAPAARRLAPRHFAGRQLVLYDRGGSIRGAIDTWLGAADRRVRVTDIGSADAQVAFVRAGFGWSIISEVVTREDAAAGRVARRALAPPLVRELVLAWRADRAARPVIAAALAVFARHASRERGAREGR